MEGDQVPARRGEEYVITRGMYLCNLRFSWREIAQEMAWPSHRVQKLVYFVFKYFKHNDRSTQTLSKKLLWQQTMADLIQPTCLLVSEERRERERSGKA